jgi:hypothetical protein
VLQKLRKASRYPKEPSAANGIRPNFGSPEKLAAPETQDLVSSWRGRGAPVRILVLFSFSVFEASGKKVKQKCPTLFFHSAFPITWSVSNDERGKLEKGQRTA